MLAEAPLHASTPDVSAVLARLPARISARIVATDSCLVWTGAKTVVNEGDAYGRAMIDGKVVFIHRLLTELVTGVRPRRLMQQCGTFGCVSPAHWSEAQIGPRIRRRETEAELLTAFEQYVQSRLRTLRRRMPAAAER